MYVIPAARRRGIARALLDHLEDEARTLGATRLRLETGLHQPEAIALYASAGYVETEPFGHYAGAPLARHLAKNLVRLSPLIIDSGACCRYPLRNRRSFRALPAETW